MCAVRTLRDPPWGRYRSSCLGHEGLRGWSLKARSPDDNSRLGLGGLGSLIPPVCKVTDSRAVGRGWKRHTRSGGSREGLVGATSLPADLPKAAGGTGPQRRSKGQRRSRGCVTVEEPSPKADLSPWPL